MNEGTNESEKLDKRRRERDNKCAEMKFGLRMDLWEDVADFRRLNSCVGERWVKVKGFFYPFILISDAFDESELRAPSQLDRLLLLDLLPQLGTSWIPVLNNSGYYYCCLPFPMCLSSPITRSRRVVPLILFSLFFSIPLLIPREEREETLFSCLISYSGTERTS